MRTTAALLLATAIAAGACQYRTPKTIAAPPTPSETEGPDFAPAATTSIGGLAGPESVLYDASQDVYFISNLNGGLLTQDNNGFISRVDAASMKVVPRWIAGGTNGVRLDAPKGMAIVGNALYVSDVGVVRKFDRRTGAALGAVELPGATCINDLTTDGRSVYASDTGIVPSAGITFAATGTDAIWKIDDTRATKIASGRELNQPNGLDFHDGALWVVSFRGNELYRLDGSRKTDVREVPRGQLDGLVHLADGSAVVASWMGCAIYRETGKERFIAPLRGIAAPADIGYDTRRHLLLVPRTPSNEVTIHVLR